MYDIGESIVHYKSCYHRDTFPVGSVFAYSFLFPMDLHEMTQSRHFRSTRFGFDHLKVDGHGVTDYKAITT